jgi:FMN-dependent NADH-azoreductase
MNVLHVDSSILGPASVSRRLSAEIVEAWKRKKPLSTVVYRDLAADPIGHLNGPLLAAAATDANLHSPELSRDLAVGADAMAEFLKAEVIVIGAPMYNFGIPSQLKSWIDRIAVRGKTFTYTPQGPKGLAGGKTVVIASSRGGYYSSGTPLAALDHQENYLRSTFGFLGITDIRFVRAEGINISPEAKQQAIAAAEQEVHKAAA